MSENVEVFKESVRELQVSHLNAVHKVSAGKNVARSILLVLRTGQRKDDTSSSASKRSALSFALKNIGLKATEPFTPASASSPGPFLPKDISP